MSPIIMTYELTFRSGRTRPAHARSSGSEMLLHTRSLVGSIIDTRESSFRKRQVVHGRHSHERQRRSDLRRRLILTRKVAAIADDSLNKKALFWNPAGA